MATKKTSQIKDAPPKPTDLEKLGLKGPVHKVVQVAHKAKRRDGIVTQGKILSDYSFHDSNFVMIFNKKGNLEIKQAHGADGINIHLFKDQDLLSEMLKYDGKGNLERKTTCIYVFPGKQPDQVSRDATGKILFGSYHTYREDGKITGHFSYRTEEKIPMSKTLNTYDERGNVISMIQYDGQDQERHRTFYKYDEHNRRVEQMSEYADEKMRDYYQRSTTKYNDRGDAIEYTSYNQDGSIRDVHTYTPEYDSEGKRILPKNNYNPNAKAEGETEELESDSHGNWIKKTTFYNKLPVAIYLREISYFDGKKDSSKENSTAAENLPFKHPYMTEEHLESKPDVMHEQKSLSPEQAQWLVEAPNSTADNFAYLRYYVLHHGEAPSLVTYSGPGIEAIALRYELINNLDAVQVHSYNTVWNNRGETTARYTLHFPDKGYLLHAPQIASVDEEEYEVPENVKRALTNSRVYDNLHIGSLLLLRPSDASGNRDMSFEEDLTEFIDKCSLRKKPDKPVINMIEVAGNSFAMREYPVDDNFEIRDLDVNYGSGFEKFHEELMQRFASSTKGLVLFHGQPGTGKTYYIRHLLRTMVSKNKVVIYMPPNMVDHLVEPAFMTFISNSIQEWSEDGNFCVLLIEDAEPLLAKRQEGVRIQGVSNLLNMTDGLLNDMLNLQIICTFNVDLRKLDSALLRPGRLIARKEFKALSELDANLLAQRLGIKHHFDRPASLGEIYAMQKNKNTLIHDVEPDRNASKPIDDF